MDPTASNRLSRGLLALSGGLNQIVAQRAEAAKEAFQQHMMDLAQQNRADDLAFRKRVEADNQQFRRDQAAQHDKEFGELRTEHASDKADQAKYRADQMNLQLKRLHQEAEFQNKRLKIAQDAADRVSKTSGGDEAKVLVDQVNALKIRSDAVKARLEGLHKQLAGSMTDQKAISGLQAKIQVETINSYRIDSDMANVTAALGKLSGVPTADSVHPGDKFIKVGGKLTPYYGQKIDGVTPTDYTKGSMDSAPDGTVFTAGQPLVLPPTPQAPPSSGADADSAPPTQAQPPQAQPQPQQGMQGFMQGLHSVGLPSPTNFFTNNG